MTTLINGVLGGAIVGGLAAAATGVVAGRTEPGAGDGTVPGSSRVVESRWTLGVLLVGYGGGLGGLLVALELFVLGALGVPPTLVEALAVAVVWSALVCSTVILAWRVRSGTTLTRARRRRLLVYHLSYGLGLAAWIRLTWIT